MCVEKIYYIVYTKGIIGVYIRTRHRQQIDIFILIRKSISSQYVQRKLYTYNASMMCALDLFAQKICVCVGQTNRRHSRKAVGSEICGRYARSPSVKFALNLSRDLADGWFENICRQLKVKCERLKIFERARGSSNLHIDLRFISEMVWDIYADKFDFKCVFHVYLSFKNIKNIGLLNSSDAKQRRPT